MKLNKRRFLIFLSILLIVAGVILLFLRSNQNAEKTEDIAAETLQSNLERDSIFDFDAIEEINPSGILLNSADENLIIGRLYIPSIELNVTVYNGVTNEILNSGVGTMRPNLVMGEGNFPIAGHYSRNKNVLFGDLNSIELGDLIYLTDNEKIYEYKVFDTKIVPPTAIELIEDDVATEHGKPVISLMNCYYVDNQNSGDRFFVFGELVDVKDYNSDN